MTFLSMFLLGSCASPAAAMGKKAPALDPVTQSTVLDGDATGLVEGCGQQPIVGFTYCRMQEGTTADKSVWFIGPPADCDKDSCVFIKVWNNQGQLVWGGSIPKKGTRIEVPWKTLLGRDTFEKAARGFWTFNTQVFWKDAEGHERDSTSQGDIVLRVYGATYVPLSSVTDDPNYYWVWTEGKRIYKMTTGLRAFTTVLP